ncbi:MAG: hypothetical protein KIT22_03945 [Verrucomicrobiae bacterium]|nr:hypothetical protein [Verrucomicrobiae bacterium]
MHSTKAFLFACLTLLPLSAQSLRFTSITVFSNNTVQVGITGPTNATFYLERLNKTNQNFEVANTFTLTTNSTTNITLALSQGNYGFIRTESTNGAVKSTNAVGVVVGTVGYGYSLLGNPFGNLTLTSIFPSPIDGMSVYQWKNATTNYIAADYIGGVGWTTNLTIAGLEGFFLSNPVTNAVRFVFSGIFATNESKTVPKGDSIIASQRLNLITPSSGLSDLLSTNDLDGFSNLPVFATGFSPQSRIGKYDAVSATYDQYYLTNSAGWYLNGVKSTVPIYLADGFWINRPTNATWSVTRPIW